jgi:uncharacterized damage-inducible protein DinB
MTGRPEIGEFAPYAQEDIDLVQGDDAVSVLETQLDQALALLAPLSETAAGFSYAPGKWSLKQVVGHMVDDERIFAYRILCVARQEPLPLPGFDENAYVAAAGFADRTLAGLLGEYRTVRAATLSLLRSFSPEAWLRRGNVNGYEASARGLAFHVAGHELHHLRILQERYLPWTAKP